MCLKMSAIETSAAKMKKDFTSKLDVVAENISGRLNDEIEGLKVELDEQMEGTDNKALIQNIDEKNKEFEFESEKAVSQKVSCMELAVLEKLRDLSKHLTERERRITERMTKLNENSVKIKKNLNEIVSKMEDIEEGLYEFDWNKKNNLIFYGIRQDGSDLIDKIDDVLREYLNIGRKLPLKRVSTIQTGSSINY